MSVSLEKQTTQAGLAYHRSGNGPTLVLIHGVGLCAESWHPQLAELHSEFDVLVPDLPEHAASVPLNADFNNASLKDYSEAIADFIEVTVDSPVILCGHSLGALIAIELAATLGAKVAGLVALNTIYERTDEALHAVQTRAKLLQQSDSVIGVQQTLERWFGTAPKNTQAEYAEQCKNWLQNNSVQGYAKAYKAFAIERGARNTSLDAISCPVIFMTGSEDLNSTAQMTEDLATYMNKAPNNGSRAKPLVVQNAGHMLPLTHPRSVCSQIHSLVA